MQVGHCTLVLELLLQILLQKGLAALRQDTIMDNYKPPMGEVCLQDLWPERP